jgi:uncharacterized protein
VREAAVETLAELGWERYLLLETRKRDGSWVGTPVSIVVEGGRGFFKSYDASGKVKRMRNFPEVRVAPCGMRGRVKGERQGARATLLDAGSADAVRAEALLARKHPVLHGWLVPAFHRRKGYKTLFYELTLEPS